MYIYKCSNIYMSIEKEEKGIKRSIQKKKLDYSQSKSLENIWWLWTMRVKCWEDGPGKESTIFFLNRYEEPVEIYIYIKTIHLYSIII